VLAPGAEVGAAPSDHDTFNSAIATGAFFAGLMGNLEVVMGGAGLAARTEIVGDAGTLPPNSLSQYTANGMIKPPGFGESDAAARPQRMDTGQKKGFIGVKIPDASYQLLFQ
jgi:hypothetical protein